jgi:hypothetical protein
MLLLFSCVLKPGLAMRHLICRGTAQSIRDDLFVRAMVLDDGATRLAFAVADTCWIGRFLTKPRRLSSGTPTCRRNA